MDRAFKATRAMLLLGLSEKVLGPGVQPDGVGQAGGDQFPLPVLSHVWWEVGQR